MKLFLTCLVIAVSGSSAATDWKASSQVSQSIKQISEQDRASLEELFRLLVCRLPFGYVLFGHKPSAFELFDAQECYRTLKEQAGTERFHVDALWPVWERYSHLFPAKRYTLTRLDFESSEGWGHELLLIDRTCARSVIKTHLDQFVQAVGVRDADGVLQELQRMGFHGLFFADSRKPPDHCVIGLLLGFGLHNSALFHAGSEARSMLARSQSVPVKPILPVEKVWQELSILSRLQIPRAFKEAKRGRVAPYSEMSAIGSAYERCQTALCGSFGTSFSENPLSVVSLPAFAYDPSHKETQDLLKDYCETRAKLTELFRRQDFLEIVLTRLCES